MTSAPATKEGRRFFFSNLSTSQTVTFTVLLYFVLRLPWLLTLPESQAPDEPNHFWVVHYIARHFSLPTFEIVHSTGPAAEYGALPTLGYIPHVLLTAIAPEALAHTFSRFGSLLIGAIVPWVAVLMGKELFGSNRLLAIALPLMVAVHPQLVFVNSYTNNDSLATALSSAIIFLLVTAIRCGLSVKRALVVGALFGVLGLSKHTGLSVAPAVVLGIAAAGYTNSLTPKQIISRLFSFGAAFAAASGWYFIRNYIEFKGDVLGTKTMYESWITILPKVNGQVQHPWPEAGKLGWWRYVFFDYVGLFGYMDRYLWRPIYVLFFGYLLAAIAGWIKPNPAAIALDDRSNVETKKDWRERKTLIIWLVIFAFPLCNLLANLAATIINVTGPHGRYLFPSELSILALVIAGLGRLKFGNQLVISLLVLNLAVTLGVWLCWYMPALR